MQKLLCLGLIALLGVATSVTNAEPPPRCRKPLSLPANPPKQKDIKIAPVLVKNDPKVSIFKLSF